MAQSVKVQVECDRCERVEMREQPPEGAKPRVGPQLHAVFKDEDGGTEQIIIEDLCTQCATLVKKYLDAISKKVEKASPARVRTA